MSIPLHIHIAAFSPLLVLASGLILLKRLSKDFKIFWTYTACSFCISLIQLFLARRGMNNLWTIHLFTPIQYAVFAWLFASWQSSPRARRVLQYSVIPFTLFSLLMFFFVEDKTLFNNISKTTECILLTIMAGQTLGVIAERTQDRLVRQPEFWISATATVYFSSMVFLYVLSNSLLEVSMDTLRFAFSVQAVITFLTNITYSMGFLCFYRR